MTNVYKFCMDIKRMTDKQYRHIEFIRQKVRIRNDSKRDSREYKMFGI